MNSGVVFYMTGKIISVEAVLLLLPTVISMLYKDGVTFEFIATAMIAALVGWFMSRKKPEDSSMFAREGFAVVALAWILLSAIGRCV